MSREILWRKRSRTVTGSLSGQILLEQRLFRPNKMAKVALSLIVNDRLDGKQSENVIKYRPDIDGLRTIAVLPVLFFHAGVRGFSGGFVGVDIFFVISGYLITGILVREIIDGHYSIFEFYKRRVIRIFPALFFMILCMLILSEFYLLPSEENNLTGSAVGAILFSSNIYFFNIIDYFNSDAHTMPLLHTWSLAVEEQWYLFWPLILWGVFRVRIKPWVPVLAILVASLSLSVIDLPTDASAVFYLLPYRAWELALGALVAIRPWSQRYPAPSSRMAMGFGVVGLALIGFAIKAYTDQTPFPGLAAVPPCLGAALLIEAGRTKNRVSRSLAMRPLRGIGLISYSLYLWHWPIIVFADVGLFLGHGPVVTIGVICLSLVLAYASWRWIEQPFRRCGSKWPTRYVLWGGGVSILGGVGAALAAPLLTIPGGALSPAQQTVARYLAFDGDGAYRRGQCFKVGWHGGYDRATCLVSSTKPQILLVGDSHAAQLWPGLSRWRDHYEVSQATATDCFARRYPDDRSLTCHQIIDYALHDWLQLHHPALTILASRWQMRYLDGLEETLRDPLLRSAHPVLIGPIPEHETALPRLLIAAQRKQDPDLLVRSEAPEPFEVDKVLKAMAVRTRTPYISLVDLLCDAHRLCRTMATQQAPLQFDYGHLTIEGSDFVTDAMHEALLKASITGDDLSKLRSVNKRLQP